MPAGANNHIGIVLYPDAQAACVHGLTDLFGVASRILLEQRQADRSPLRVTHWQSTHDRSTTFSCVYDSAPGETPQPRLLIIPTTLSDPDPVVPSGVVSWLRKQHAAGATLVSLCSGAFALADAIADLAFILPAFDRPQLDVGAHPDCLGRLDLLLHRPEEPFGVILLREGRGQNR